MGTILGTIILIIIIAVIWKIYGKIVNRIYKNIDDKFRAKQQAVFDMYLEEYGMQPWQVPEKISPDYWDKPKSLVIADALLPETIISHVFWDTKQVWLHKINYIGIGGSLLLMVVLTWISSIVSVFEMTIGNYILWAARVAAFLPVIELLQWKERKKYQKVSGIIYGIVLVLFICIVQFNVL